MKRLFKYVKNHQTAVLTISLALMLSSSVFVLIDAFHPAILNSNHNSEKTLGASPTPISRHSGEGRNPARSPSDQFVKGLE